MLTDLLKSVFLLNTKIQSSIRDTSMPEYQLTWSKIFCCSIYNRRKCSANWMCSKVFWVPSTSLTPLIYQFTIIDSCHWLIASSHGCEDIIWIFFIWDLNPSLKCFLWVLRKKTLDSISCLLLLHFYLLTNFASCCPDILNFKMKKIDWPKTCIDSSIEKSKISRILCKHLSKNLNLIFVERAFLHFTLLWRIPISLIYMISLSLL